MHINDIFAQALSREASDVHCVSYRKPIIRIDGKLVELDMNELDPKSLEGLVKQCLNQSQFQELVERKSVDIIHALDLSHRFRVNFFWERGSLVFAARVIRNLIPTLLEISMPLDGWGATRLKEGLVLVTGPTGSGKSTTLASIIQQINMERTENIVTLEDPIEFVFPPGRSLIKQRQQGTDVLSYADALRSVLRQDPDVIMVGEMRDPETIAATITLAETGHLVFSTLHTLNTAQTINRVIDSFSADQQGQIRLQLALTLKCVISQRLIQRIGGGRIAAREVLINTPAIANLIREHKIEHIASAMQTGTRDGMVTMDMSLALLYRQGQIRKEDAAAFMIQPSLLDRA